LEDEKMNRGKTKLFSVFIMLFVSFLALSGAVTAINAEIDWVKVDGDELTPGLNTIQDIERDNTFPVRVQVTALEDLEDVEVEAMISGYDHNDRVSDVTDVFDMKANVSYRKDLELKLPPRIDVDQYRLRIYVRDRASSTLEQEYYVYVDTTRHSVRIKDVDVDPAGEVEAGRSMRVLVDVKNFGQLDEDDVKVEFLIPELGLKALPDYVDVEAGETKVSEELYLRIPVCTEPGQYTAQVKITYDEGDEVETQNVYVDVVESPVCEASTSQPTTRPSEQPSEQQPVVQEKTVITVGAQAQDLTRGEGGAIYPVTFTNSGSASKTDVVGVAGADDWATVKISPLQTVTVGAGESKSVYVYVSAKETAEPSEHMFTVDVKDASGNVVKQIPMSANVLESENGSEQKGSLRKALEIGLIVLVLILIIVILVVVFTRKKEDDEEETEDEISGQTYY
jgi:uncharacterized membrane protein